MNIMATVEEIADLLVVEAPGISQMQTDYQGDERRRRVVIGCPACRARTERQLVAGDTFEIAHKRRCRLKRKIAHFLANHPELVGTTYAVVGFAPGTRWTPPPQRTKES